MSTSRHRPRKQQSDTDRERQVKQPAPVVHAPISSVDDGATPLMEPMGADFSERTFRRHASLLVDRHFSHPANAGQRAQIVQRLQEDYGNTYVMRLVDHIMRSGASGASGSLAGSPMVQAAEEEDRTGDSYEVTPDVGARIEKERGSGKPLEPETRREMETTFGQNLGDVRIHSSPEADRLNREVHAEAFTIGSDVFFREGNYAPKSDWGKGLLAHELTHVVHQHEGGSVQRMCPECDEELHRQTAVQGKQATGKDKPFSDYFGECLETMGLPAALAAIWATPGAVFGALKIMQAALAGASAAGITTVADLIAAVSLAGESGAFVALGGEVLAVIGGIAASAFIGIIIGCLADSLGKWSAAQW